MSIFSSFSSGGGGDPIGSVTYFPANNATPDLLTLDGKQYIKSGALTPNTADFTTAIANGFLDTLNQKPNTVLPNVDSLYTGYAAIVVPTYNPTTDLVEIWYVTNSYAATSLYGPKTGSNEYEIKARMNITTGSSSIFMGYSYEMNKYYSSFMDSSPAVYLASSADGVTWSILSSAIPTGTIPASNTAGGTIWALSGEYLHIFRAPAGSTAQCLQVNLQTLNAITINAMAANSSGSVRAIPGPAGVMVCGGNYYLYSQNGAHANTTMSGKGTSGAAHAWYAKGSWVYADTNSTGITVRTIPNFGTDSASYTAASTVDYGVWYFEDTNTWRAYCATAANSVKSVDGGATWTVAAHTVGAGGANYPATVLLVDPRSYGASAKCVNGYITGQCVFTENSLYAGSAQLTTVEGSLVFNPSDSTFYLITGSNVITVAKTTDFINFTITAVLYLGNVPRKITVINGKMFILGANGGQYSTNGIAWTTFSYPGGWIYDMAYVAGKYVGVGGATSNLNVWYSTDLIAWTGATAISTTTTITNIASNGTVAVVSTPNSSAQSVAYSTNGTSWTNASTMLTYASKTLMHDGTRFLVNVPTTTPYAGNKVYSSTDGNTWTVAGSSTMMSTYYQTEMYYANGKYFIFDSNMNIVYKSTNLSTWTQIPMTQGAKLYGSQPKLVSANERVFIHWGGTFLVDLDSTTTYVVSNKLTANGTIGYIRYK